MKKMVKNMANLAYSQNDVMQAERLEDMLNCEKEISSGMEFIDLVSFPEILKTLAAKLYGCPESRIVSMEQDQDFSYPNQNLELHEVCFDNNECSRLYVKRAAEGPLLEGAGQELMNILSNTPNRYMLAGEDVIMVEHVDGREFSNLDFKLKNNPDFIFNYGVAQETARFLALGDRHSKNVLHANDGKVVNIDFGWLFKEPGYDPYFGGINCAWLSTKTLNEGREHAKNLLLKNLQANLPKIRKIYQLVDEEIYLCYSPLHILSDYCTSEGWKLNSKSTS